MLGLLLIFVAATTLLQSSKCQEILEGVDISHYQTKVNFTKAVEGGIDVVIHKATQGTSYVDRLYARRKECARKAGVKYWGAYHFADGEEGVKQAEHFLKTAGSATFYALDFEDNPAGYGSTITLEQAEKLVTTVTEKTGRRPFIYGGAYFLDKWDRSEILAACPLWVASWKETPHIPKMWSNWTIWQYTDGEHGSGPHYVPGIGKCDRNKINLGHFNQLVTANIY